MSNELVAFDNCFITFPSLHDDSDNQSTTELKYEKDVPVIILLGWTGCQHRHLEKYSAIYEKKCITICYVAPVEDTFVHLSRLQSAAEKLIQLIVDDQLQENPIFVHTFSNGGVRVYRFLSDLIHKRKPSTSVNLCGVIFDSTPSQRYILRGMVAFMNVINYPLFVKYLAAALLFVWFLVSTIISLCAEYVPFVSITADDYWEFMCEDPASCPHLYLYSVQDTLIPYKDVEKMIAMRRSQGVDVMTQRWDDSAHVAHLIAHREAYITACLDFLQRCLRAS